MTVTSKDSKPDLLRKRVADVLHMEKIGSYEK